MLALISPAGMGMGDVKAAAGIGTMLAWPGWRLLIAGGFAGFLLAAIYGIALLASGRATRKQHMPFGPFMLAGAFAVILAWHVISGPSWPVAGARSWPQPRGRRRRHQHSRGEFSHSHPSWPAVRECWPA